MGQWEPTGSYQDIASPPCGHPRCTAQKACYPWFIVEGLTTGCAVVKEVSVALAMGFFSLSADDEADSMIPVGTQV